MVKARWMVYWNECSADTYLYGSRIGYHRKDDVEFTNLLMPPGTVIKQWYSKTNFQAQKIEPALPMIDGESSYRIRVSIDEKEDEHVLIRLIFYDRYEVEAGSLTIRDRESDFRCPLKTYSYRLQLINGGVSSFRFHSISIEEIDDEEKQGLKKTGTDPKRGKKPRRPYEGTLRR